MGRESPLAPRFERNCAGQNAFTLPKQPTSSYFLTRAAARRKLRRERRKFSHLSAHSASTMEYIGREVAKTFKNHGTFKGKVLDYDKQHGFHVEYEDGDSEDMKESCLLYTSPSPRDQRGSRMPSSA